MWIFNGRAYILCILTRSKRPEPDASSVKRMHYRNRMRPASFPITRVFDAGRSDWICSRARFNRAQWIRLMRQGMYNGARTAYPMREILIKHEWESNARCVSRSDHSVLLDAILRELARLTFTWHKRPGWLRNFRGFVYRYRGFVRVPSRKSSRALREHLIHERCRG